MEERVGGHGTPLKINKHRLFMVCVLATQSLLAALGSVQFVSNVAFAYFVLDTKVTTKVMLATVFIVLGNIFLVAFGNHQSPVYTPEQLVEKFSNLIFLLYCLGLILVIVFNHLIYRRGELLLSSAGHDLKPYWPLLLPFSYAIVSGALGSYSVLFAKSLSNLLRLTMSSHYEFHSWFTYSMLLFFLSTAGFWMTRLNEGLALFDAILIVPMFQIAWTFFSICTGFIYFQEYQVFNSLRTTMFILGMVSVFTGISLLAPEDSKGHETKNALPITSQPSSFTTDLSRSLNLIEKDVRDPKSLGHAVLTRARTFTIKARAACTLSLGLGEDQIGASSVLTMPMLSSRMTTSFRGSDLDQEKFLSLRNTGSAKGLIEEDGKEMETTSLLM
ncbi:hypothetical protein AMTR_s00016p00244190 [Amborella trichopoda]|uniref:Probable magnesium transporter n=1 Tax=Amborella trichopoda TaxID=13333 RepID=W1P904_AMBTC|nr:hypothetical protein AMTR_s00016p00244190 [Amborella trichopoda]